MATELNPEQETQAFIGSNLQELSAQKNLQEEKFRTIYNLRRKLKLEGRLR